MLHSGIPLLTDSTIIPLQTVNPFLKNLCQLNVSANAYKIIFIDTLYLYSLRILISGIVAICVCLLPLLSFVLLFDIHWSIKYSCICEFLYLHRALSIEYCACSPWRLLSCSLPFTDWGQACDEMLVGGLFICLIVNGLYLLIQYCQNDN